MAHEWVGAGMFALFLLHHLLNQNWHKRLFQGKYTPMRILTLCVDLLFLLDMLAMMVSSILLSRHVFAFLSIEQGITFARRLHILGAYWGFLLMSIHLGLHWNMMVSMALKPLHWKPSTPRKIIAFVVALLIAAYGGYAFIRRDFPTYLFLQSEFVFFDYSEPIPLFYLDYLALMGLCIFLAHYGAKLLRRKKKGG